MTNAIIGVLFILIATSLFAYAARITKLQSSALAKNYLFVATVPLLVTCLLVLGVALCWKYAAEVGGSMGWALGAGTIVLVAVLFWVFWRVFHSGETAPATVRSAG